MPAKPALEEMFQDTQTDKPLRNERIYTAVREHDCTLFQLQKLLGVALFNDQSHRKACGRAKKVKEQDLIPIAVLSRISSLRAPCLYSKMSKAKL